MPEDTASRLTSSLDARSSVNSSSFAKVLPLSLRELRAKITALLILLGSSGAMPICMAMASAFWNPKPSASSASLYGSCLTTSAAWAPYVRKSLMQTEVLMP